jgi:hypothetical protein
VSKFVELLLLCSDISFASLCGGGGTGLQTGETFGYRVSVSAAFLIYDILCDFNGQINEAGARLEGPEHGVVRTCLMNL